MTVADEYYWYKLYICTKLSIIGKRYQYPHSIDQGALGFCYKIGPFDIFLVVSIFLVYYDIGDNLGWISSP